jgi:hypothetical protein
VDSILGKIVLGEWQLGQTSSTPATVGTGQGKTTCKGFAVAALVVSALGIVHASATCVKAVHIRVTQVAAEVVYEQTAAAAVRVTQSVAEVVYEQTANATVRVTQVALEAVIETFPTFEGAARCSGSSLATIALTATAQGRTAARGGIAAATAVPVVARGRVSAWGRSNGILTRIALIGQATASGSVQASISQTAGGRTCARGSISATLALHASAVGLTRARGGILAVPTASGSARGLVQTQGFCVIGIAGSGPACLTGNDAPGLPAPNFAY